MSAKPASILAMAWAASDDMRDLALSDLRMLVGFDKGQATVTAAFVKAGVPIPLINLLMACCCTAARK
jgi:hypothetical protein